MGGAGARRAGARACSACAREPAGQSRGGSGGTGCILYCMGMAMDVHMDGDGDAAKARPAGDRIADCTKARAYHLRSQRSRFRQSVYCAVCVSL